MDFGEALKLLRQGKRMRRLLWASGTVPYPAWLELKDPGEGFLPGLYVYSPIQGGYVQWGGVHSDILGDDWVEHEEP